MLARGVYEDPATANGRALPVVEVPVAVGDLGVDAVLVVDDRQLRAELRGTVERGPEQADELVVVGQAERRPDCMGERRRRARALAVRVEGEAVHDRAGSLECTV